MSAADVPVKKELIYYGAQDYYRNAYGMPVSNQKVAAYLEIQNSKENRLGLPLPKGKVRVYKADSGGSQQFIGEDWIDHTAKDERVKIKLGNAFDVTQVDIGSIRLSTIALQRSVVGRPARRSAIRP
jgi:hypothetical protein